MKYIGEYLVPRTADVSGGNYFTYRGDLANQTMSDIKTVGFFEYSKLKNKDLIKITASDQEGLFTVNMDDFGSIVITDSDTTSINTASYPLVIEPSNSNVIFKSPAYTYVVSKDGNGSGPYFSSINEAIIKALADSGAGELKCNIILHEGEWDTPAQYVTGVNIVGVDVDKCIVNCTEHSFIIQNIEPSNFANFTVNGTVANKSCFVCQGGIKAKFINMKLNPEGTPYGLVFNDPSNSEVNIKECEFPVGDYGISINGTGTGISTFVIDKCKYVDILSNCDNVQVLLSNSTAQVSGNNGSFILDNVKAYKSYFISNTTAGSFYIYDSSSKVGDSYYTVNIPNSNNLLVNFDTNDANNTYSNNTYSNSQTSIVDISANYTTNGHDYNILAKDLTSNIDITIPDLISIFPAGIIAGLGKRYLITNSSVTYNVNVLFPTNVIGGDTANSAIITPSVTIEIIYDSGYNTWVILGKVSLQNDISDITSQTRIATPYYVNSLIEKTIINPNKLNNADWGVVTDIPLTGSVTYNGNVIPDGKRVVVTGQVDSKLNGVYLSNDAGAWTRTVDADTVEKLYLSQIVALNGTKGSFLCSIDKNALLGTSIIPFVQLYQTNDGAIGVFMYTSTTIYDVNALVVNPSVDSFIYRCLIAGTVNIAPSMASPNWEIYQGMLYSNSAIVSPNGDDTKSVGFPYLTFTGAIVDMPIDSYIEARTIVNTETVTPKAGMLLAGKKAQVNNIVINVDNVSVEGVFFANTLGTDNAIGISDCSNFTLTKCKANKVGGAYAISVSGAWGGINKIDGVELTGDISITGTTTNGVIYLQNIHSISVVNLNCSNATVYISNCPNLTYNKTAGSVIINDAEAYVGDYKLSHRTANFGDWLLCDGAVVSRTTYKYLFDVIGTTYGAGDGSTTFGLPNFAGKTLQAAGGGYAMGVNTGNESYTLVQNNLPTHTHAIDHDHTSFTSGTGSNHTHTLSHTHAIDHDHPSTSVTGSAQQYSTTTNPASGAFAAPYVRDSDGSKYADGQYDELRFYINGGSSYIQPGDMDWLLIGSVSQSVNLPAFTGSSGAASQSTTSGESSHTHSIDVPSYTGSSGNNTTTGASFSLFQPTSAMGNIFICWKGKF